jgi:hypothetical protein
MTDKRKPEQAPLAGTARRMRRLTRAFVMSASVMVYAIPITIAAMIFSWLLGIRDDHYYLVITTAFLWGIGAGMLVCVVSLFFIGAELLIRWVESRFNAYPAKEKP